MLRYYSYYSVGGYKDFYLGSNADQFDASYYLSLLPQQPDRYGCNKGATQKMG